MIFDWDDHHPGNDAMPWLEQLKAIRPDFKCTLFAIPGLGLPDFWEAHPDWVELAVHGWFHPDAYECSEWTADRMQTVIYARPNRFVRGFKAPGWQISDGCYEALNANGWWLADQPYNDHRRPEGLRVHLLSPAASSGEDPNHWHGHVQDVCGNGFQETWGRLVEAVKAAPSFEFVSEAVSPWTG